MNQLSYDQFHWNLPFCVRCLGDGYGYSAQEYATKLKAALFRHDCLDCAGTGRMAIPPCEVNDEV